MKILFDKSRFFCDCHECKRWRHLQLLPPNFYDSVESFLKTLGSNNRPRIERMEDHDFVQNTLLLENTSAAGLIETNGGHLAFSTYSLTIPSHALTVPKFITFTPHVTYAEEGGIFDQDKRPLVQMSPTIRCGPDGTEFDKPVTIRCPHTISNTNAAILNMLKVYTRGSAEWRWNKFKASSVKVVKQLMEIQIDHFSDVMVAIDLDDLVGAVGGEELPTIDIMLSTMMKTDSAGHLQMNLIITTDSAFVHESFQADVYNYVQRGNQATRVSHRTRWVEISPQTAIQIQLSNPGTGAQTHTRVIDGNIVSQLAGHGHTESFDIGPITTTCDVRLSQQGINNAHQFTAALNQHKSQDETAFQFSRSRPEQTSDDLPPAVIRAIEEYQLSSRPG